MSTPKRLLLAFAHPDDESNLAGSTIAKYSAE
jgi:LmbE family N-acetylglucosaminyl deacetylase